MWRPLSSWRDESDSEFIIWHVRAESDDGRTQTVDVKVNAHRVAIEDSLADSAELTEVRVAIATEGKSVILRHYDLEDLPTSFVYRLGHGGFYAVWD